jgi:murein peptide amidase A
VRGRAGDAERAGAPGGYDDLVAAWRELRPRGVRVREVACVGAPRTLLLAELGDGNGPLISISAGVHGDEPAACWALLSLVRDGRLWPCLNPSGYVAGTRENADRDDVNRSFSRGGTTPESRAVFTANRDRRFDFAMDLHEDYEADGCYVYEPLRPGFTPLFSERIVTALDDAGLPVQPLHDGYELGAPAGADPEEMYRLDRGTVLVDYETELRVFDGLPGSIALMYRGSPAALTFESPAPRPWDERIAAHRIAVTTALATLR